VTIKVYLDNSATTKADPEVIKAMLPYFSEKYGNPSSMHSFGQDAKEAIAKSRKIIADSIGADEDEIIFTSGGTESDNLALKGIATALKNKGNHIITSSIEHPAILATCRELSNAGYTITYLKIDSKGFVNLEELRQTMTKNTILVSIMHANNEIGTIQDIDAIGKICLEKGVLFHTDAVQSYTKVPINVKEINVDLISLASHKIHGPKGVGAIYIKKKTPIKNLLHGGGHEYKRRAGTENVPGIVGFAKAVQLANETHNEQMKQLRDRLIDGLLKIPYTQLNGSKDKRLCNNANIAFNHIEGEAILMMLDAQGIAVSTGSACSSNTLKPSHVLMALGLKHEIAHGCIRFTLSKFTTKEEIDYTIEKVRTTVEKLRKISPISN